MAYPALAEEEEKATATKSDYPAASQQQPQAPQAPTAAPTAAPTPQAPTVFAPSTPEVQVEKPKVFAPNAPEVPVEQPKAKVFAPSTPEVPVEQQPPQPSQPQTQPTPPQQQPPPIQPPPLVTDPETGTRYVVDPGTGQKIPYAEPATAADKAAQPPDTNLLPKVTVTDAPTPRATPVLPAPSAEQSQQDQINLLISQGKSPGEAQAIVNGQQPTTVTGKTPAPKPAAPQPSPQPEQPQKAPEPASTLQAGKNNAVDPVQLYSYLLGKFSHSPLVNYVPPDGARWGIKTGSAAEWAAFGLAVAKQESDLNTRSYNAADPGGSAGLFQFGQGQTQFTNGTDQFNPQASADSFVRSVEHFLANKGSVANMGETFGSIRRPNEAGQYIAGAQKVAAGGSGKDLVSSGGGGSGSGSGSGSGKGHIKGMGTGTDTLVPMLPTQQGGFPSAQTQTPLGTGGGTAGSGQAPEAPTIQGGGWFGGFGGGAGDSGGSAAQPAQPAQPRPAAQAAPPEAEPPENPLVAALVKRGFTQQQAVNFAQSSQTVAPGKGVPPLQAPPPAPSAPAQLPGAQIKLLSSKQLMPGKVPPIVPKKQPPAAPGKPLQLTGPAPQQAQAPPPPAPSGKAPVTPSQQAPARQPQAAQAPAKPPPPPKDQPTQFTGRPAGSTHGVPNPDGPDAFAGMTMPQALKAHAAALSPDDPRVKKQADGYVKGEHFVEGDVLHNDLLQGLPYGRQGRQRELLGQAETAIADKSPMHISYISAPKEAAKFPTRDTRKVQYEEHSPEARLMGTTEGQLVGHSFIPLNVGVKLPGKKGEKHESYVQGISTNVLANNFQHTNDKLAAMGRKTPYEKLGAKFYNDLEGYYSNLLAGHTGTGRGFAIGTAEHPNEPDANHVPYKLSRKEADFLNVVINNTASFAKHSDAKAIRELARANGTLIDAKTGETNALRHAIEEHEPGWRNRVLEPTIRSFRTGLIHSVHPSEEHMPETIRPGKEFQQLTKAIARTSERGRPDIPIAASLHHTFADNAKINEIERDFSEHRISELEARARLKDLGEDPGDYRYIGGSGGLISPHESDPEAITQDEHDAMKSSLRQQWIGGKLDIENYRRKSAEIPLPTRPSKPPTQSKEDEPGEIPSSSTPADPGRSGSLHSTPRLSDPIRSPASQEPTTAPLPKPKAPKPKPVVPQEPPETPQEPATPAQAPPAPTGPAEPLPPPVKKPKAKPAPAPEPEAEEKLTKPAGAADKAWMKDPKNEAERQSYLEKRVAASIGRQNDHPSAIPLKVQRNEQGGVQHDPNLNPVWEKTDYDIANLPFLQKKKKALSQLEGADKHEDTLGEDEHKHLNQVERKRLSAMRKASAVKTMGDHIFNSYNSIKDQPDIAAGKGWYSRMRDKMAKVFGASEEGKASEDHELFAQLLGATSAKTPVRDNFIQALDAFEQHKAGKFDRHVEKYKEAYSAMQDGGYKALNQKMREQGILKEGDADPKTDAAAMARWIDHHDIIPKKQNGAKYNSNSEQVLKVLAGKWLDEVAAPKTPNFAGNLTGRTLAATIDVWAARHLHRLGHEHAGEKKGWRPQSAAEPGVNSLDFAFSQDAMKHAADKIGINPDDLQAILWYAEKHHYDKHGWTGSQGAEKGSFDETWDKAFPTEGKAMTSKELQEHYQAEKKAADKAAKQAKKLKAAA